MFTIGQNICSSKSLPDIQDYFYTETLFVFPLVLIATWFEIDNTNLRFQKYITCKDITGKHLKWLSVLCFAWFYRHGVFLLSFLKDFSKKLAVLLVCLTELIVVCVSLRIKTAEWKKPTNSFQFLILFIFPQKFTKYNFSQ